MEGLDILGMYVTKIKKNCLRHRPVYIYDTKSGLDVYGNFEKQL